MSSWFNGLMGKAVAPTQELSASTLLERVQNATTTEDRRKAISDLRNMSDNPAHVKTIGTEGLPILMKRLRNDKTDVDGTRGIVQLLISIMSIAVRLGSYKANSITYSLHGSELRTVPLGTPQYENIVRFVKDPTNAAIILSLLEENDRNIRYFSTKLLTYLLANKGAEIEAAVLQSGANITRLMDLLKLGNEMIRNEALLLLIEITKTNVELQKVIAYESGFENLLSIIESEGLANGGIVVQDCLTLINNLLSNNVSNQNQFREMNCIKRLPDLLAIDPSDLWTLSDDKKDILNLTLNAVSSLLSSPSATPVTVQTVPSPKDSTSTLTVTSALSSQIQSTQTQLGIHRVHARVIDLALGDLKAPTVRIKAMWCLGDLIFDHPKNRTFLEQHDFKAAQGNGRVSAMLKVTQVLFTSKIPMEALAAHHVLKCYFHNNPEGQRIFAAPICSPHAASPSSTASSNPTNPQQQLQSDLNETYPGRLIAKNLLSWQTHNDMARTFHAAMVLGYILESNAGVKAQLLKHLVADGGAQPENIFAKLLKSLMHALQANSELPIIIAFLRVLGIWCDEFPAAVAQLRSTPTNLNVLQDLAKQQGVSLHIGGLAAYLLGLCIDVATEFQAMGPEASNAITTKLEQLRRTTEFLQAERGGARLHDEESKLPFFDSPFIVSCLRLILRISPNMLFSSAATLSQPVLGDGSGAPKGLSAAAIPPTFTPTTPPAVTAVASGVPPSAPASAHPHSHTNGTSHAHNHAHAHTGVHNHNHAAPSAAHPAVAAPVHHHPHHAAHHAPHHAPHPHPASGAPGTHPHAPTASSPDGAARAELESLRSQVAGLLQAQRAWQQEKHGLETHLHQLQGHVTHIQSQLQSKQAQCESLVTQLTSLQQSASASLHQDGALQQKYDALRAEHDHLVAHHEDLLVMLGEKEDENEALRAQLSKGHSADAELL